MNAYAFLFAILTAIFRYRQDMVPQSCATTMEYAILPNLDLFTIYSSQYANTGEEGPAVLLVHGFGAFLEHYRDNICNIANGGNRVWAVTLLGFGRSEKPNVVYTELLWAELLRDFIVEVVEEPVHIVGNSIGGILSLHCSSCIYTLSYPLL